MANPQNSTNTLVTDNAVKQLSDGNTDGTVLGQSPADFIGFFGASPAGAGGANPAVQQPASSGSLRGATGTVTTYSTTQSPTSVAPNNAAEQALTVTGVATGQLVIATKPTAQAGLIVGSARVSASNTVEIDLGNATAATITPTATETWVFDVIPASMLLTPTLSPAAVGPNASAEQQFAVAGVGAGAAVAVNKPTAQAGLIITGARAVSAGVIGITFANLTAATITPTAAEVYKVFAQAGISLAPVEQVVTAALTPTSVAANTSAEQTFTVPGLPVGAQVFVSKPSSQPGLSIGGARVSALNTLAINYVNVTGAAIVPNAENYTIGLFPNPSAAAGSSNAFNAAAGGGDHAALVALGLVGGP